jgi:uncharacterized protein (DUF2336 family)
MMPNAQSLIAELDTTLSKASRSKHSTILRSVTDLFFNGAQNYSKEHVAVFDDVIDRLVEKVEKNERPTLIELSTRLAPLSNAPVKVIGRLSRNDDFAIAAPLLGKSEVLTDEVLVDIAKTKGQYYLSAIAGRTRIDPSVADVLVERGNSDVARKVAANLGAKLSELGYVKLIKRAQSDKELAALITARGDMPDELRPFLKPAPA